MPQFNQTGFNQYGQTAINAANAYGIPVDVFLKQITQESGWNIDARSSTGVRGIAQITKATADDLGIDRLNPISAIWGAAKYDAQNFSKFGDWSLAMAAYNAGPGNVEDHGYDFGSYPDPSQVSGYVKKTTGSILGPIIDSIPGLGGLGVLAPGIEAGNKSLIDGIKDYFSEIVPGFVLGIVGLILILGGLMIFAGPRVEKVIKKVGPAIAAVA